MDKIIVLRYGALIVALVIIAHLGFQMIFPKQEIKVSLQEPDTLPNVQPSTENNSQLEGLNEMIPGNSMIEEPEPWEIELSEMALSDEASKYITNITMDNLSEQYGLRIVNLYYGRNIILAMIHKSENFTGLGQLPNLLFIPKRNATQIELFLDAVEKNLDKDIIQIRYYTDYDQDPVHLKFLEELRKTKYKTWMVGGFVNDSGRYSLSGYISSGAENLPKFNLTQKIDDWRLVRTNRVE